MSLETKNLGLVAGLIASSVAPTNTLVIWLDTSSQPYTHKSYNSVTGLWVAIDHFNHIIGDGVAKLTVGTVAPTNPAVGDLWYDTN